MLHGMDIGYWQSLHPIIHYWQRVSFGLAFY